VTSHAGARRLGEETLMTVMTRSCPHPGREGLPRRLASAILLAAAMVTGGCATLRSVHSEVTSHARWPAERKPGSFQFERLPSQQAAGEEQRQLEVAAARALQAAGFVPAAEGATPDVRVQVGARIGRSTTPWVDDRLYGSWGWPYARGAWIGPGSTWGLGLGWRLGDTPRWDREVALLLRDGRTGTPLYETRAVSEGGGGFSASLMAALFEAALRDFPQPPAGTRAVRVQLPETMPTP
jgi:hypothetical protein